MMSRDELKREFDHVRNQYGIAEQMANPFINGLAQMHDFTTPGERYNSASPGRTWHAQVLFDLPLAQESQDREQLGALCSAFHMHFSHIAMREMQAFASNVVPATEDIECAHAWLTHDLVDLLLAESEVTPPGLETQAGLLGTNRALVLQLEYSVLGRPAAELQEFVESDVTIQVGAYRYESTPLALQTYTSAPPPPTPSNDASAAPPLGQ